jgi:hypothetical protein
LYVTREVGEKAKVESRAATLREYKRHVEYDDSIGAVREVDQMLAEAAKLAQA